MEIRINEDDLHKLLKELAHLRDQVAALQTRGTRGELENRDLRAIVRRVEQFPPLSTLEQYRFEQFDEATQAAVAVDELRRSHLWMRLRGVFGVKE
jgi:regulator of replication initiation timing